MDGKKKGGKFLEKENASMFFGQAPAVAAMGERTLQGGDFDDRRATNLAELP